MQNTQVFTPERMDLILLSIWFSGGVSLYIMYKYYTLAKSIHIKTINPYKICKLVKTNKN